jgi:hypothetical protein
VVSFFSSSISFLLSLSSRQHVMGTLNEATTAVPSSMKSKDVNATDAIERVSAEDPGVLKAEKKMTMPPLWPSLPQAVAFPPDTTGLPILLAHGRCVLCPLFSVLCSGFDFDFDFQTQITPQMICTDRTSPWPLLSAASTFMDLVAPPSFTRSSIRILVGSTICAIYIIAFGIF